jgi:hypothetical protein
MIICKEVFGRVCVLSLGVMFSGTVDADISFGYGMFSPRCRLADIADMKTFAMTLPVPPASGPDTQKRLQASLNALKSLW